MKSPFKAVDLKASEKSNTCTCTYNMSPFHMLIVTQICITILVCITIYIIIILHITYNYNIYYIYNYIIFDWYQSLSVIKFSISNIE